MILNRFIWTWASILAAVAGVTAGASSAFAVQGGPVFDEAISRSFTVLNRGVEMPPTGEAISRSFTILNRPPAGPAQGEAISRAFTVLNRGINPMSLDEAISRAFTILNRGVPAPPPIGEAISRAFTILNNGIPICGDGFVVGTEECDDGNILNGDGCDSECMLEDLCGDFDADLDVDGDDFALFLASFGRAVGDLLFNSSADFDSDGFVTLVDFQLWIICYREFVGDPAAPLPATAGTLGDLDADHDIDLVDFSNFQSCMSHPSDMALACILKFDFDDNGSVALDDYIEFVAVFEGPR